MAFIGSNFDRIDEKTAMTIEQQRLIDLAMHYLDRQSWFMQAAGDRRDVLRCTLLVQLSDAEPGLFRMVFEKGDIRLQLFVGTRRSSGLLGTLHNQDASLLGAVEIDGDSHLAYDALADDECCRVLLGLATSGAEEGLRVRRVASLVSHASLVFDDRLFMKCYRILEEGERPEAALLFGLDAVGFNAMVAPVARWREDSVDLALVREYLPSALEGRVLALTSLRDLLAYVNETEDESGFHAIAAGDSSDEVAASAGGDVAGEIRRLGQTTARLHLALAEVFGDEPYFADGAADGESFGRAIRLHGDFHLRRVMRSDAGWLISGFGDDPIFADVAPGEPMPVHFGSPLEDVSDMFLALEEVAYEALRLRLVAEQPFAEPLCEAWIRRNRWSFLRGYLEVGGIERLLPSSKEQQEQLLAQFLLVRERRYRAL